MDHYTAGEIAEELIQRQIHTNGMEFVPVVTLARLQRQITAEFARRAEAMRIAEPYKGTVRYA
jgi:hypothetical protein